MQSKSAAYFAALTAPAAIWRYGLDVLAADEITPLEDTTLADLFAADRLVEASASVAVDVTAKSHRTHTLNLRNSDGRYLPGVAGYPSGGPGSPTATGLVWYNVRFRPWIELRTGFTAAGAEVWDRTNLGIFVIVKPQVQVKNVGTQINLNLIDKSALLCSPFLISNSTLPTFTKNSHTVGGYAKSSTFDSVMADLATKAGVPASKQLFTPSTLTLPADYSITEGTEWWTHLQTLAGSMAHVIYFDGNGNLVRRPNPLITNIPSVWTYAPGPTSIITEMTRDTDLANTYNHIIVIGAASTTTTYRGAAQITDPTNPYHANSIGDRICYVGKDGKLNDMTPDPTIGSTGQANTKAAAILAQHIGQQEAVVIKTRNIPPLEPYDRVTVAVPQSGLNTDFLITNMTWQLAHDQMEIQGSKWFLIGS